jgi:hypothetical protein
VDRIANPIRHFVTLETLDISSASLIPLEEGAF